MTDEWSVLKTLKKELKHEMLLLSQSEADAEAL